MSAPSAESERAVNDYSEPLTEAELSEACTVFASIAGCEGFNVSRYHWTANPRVEFTRQGVRYDIPIGSIHALRKAIKAVRRQCEQDSVWKASER